jgi:hypothetical protein
VVAPLSPSTTCSSTDADDVLSVLSTDDGYNSLSDCSASVCELIDPADYSTLLATLAVSISPDKLDSKTILGDACHNLFKCVPELDQYGPVLVITPKQDHQLEVSPSPSDAGHTSNKPDVSYIEIIANALMTNNNSVLLADIYKYITDTYPYYKHTTNSWRTSIRHNLSVNECFVKGKRSKSGHGYFWSVHPSCMDSFKNGDFDRRKARRQVQHCNRAFGSALAEMNQLSQMTQFKQSQQPLLPAGDVSMSQQIPSQHYPGHTIGVTSYMPISSTPVRAPPRVQCYQQPHGYNTQQQISYNQPQHVYIQPQHVYNTQQHVYNQPPYGYPQPNGCNLSYSGYY